MKTIFWHIHTYLTGKCHIYTQHKYDICLSTNIFCLVIHFIAFLLIILDVMPIKIDRTSAHVHILHFEIWLDTYQNSIFGFLVMLLAIVMYYF